MTAPELPLPFCLARAEPDRTGAAQEPPGSPSPRPPVSHAPRQPQLGRVVEARQSLEVQGLLPVAPARTRRPVAPTLLSDAAAGIAAVAALRLPLGVGAALVVAGLVAFRAKGLFRDRLTLSALDDLPVVTSCALLCGAVVTALAELDGGAGWAGAALLAAALWAAFATALRTVVYAVIRSRRRREADGRRTLIVGAGVVGLRLGVALEDHPEYGLHAIGYVDDAPLPQVDVAGAAMLGRPADLPVLIAATGAQVVVVAFSSLPETDLVDILRQCDRLDCDFYIVPRLFELNVSSGRVDSIWGVPVLPLQRPAFRSRAWVLKRVFDVTVAAAVLVMALPVMVLASLALRRETGAGVLFRQTRLGLDARPFDLLKLQTMVPADDRESQTRWNIGNDKRVGRVGRLLRCSSVDELPQLWNVLRGDMSLVGPRPERPLFAEAFQQRLSRYGDRHRVPVGLTGWAQVHGLRGDTSIADRASFDNFYIEHWSLWGDVKILLRTVPAALRRSEC